MESTGLLPGQRWKVEPGPLWQARLDRTGAAHVIGQGLAGHEGYAKMYLDANGEVTHLHADEWVSFEHACRMSRAGLPVFEHEPMDTSRTAAAARAVGESYRQGLINAALDLIVSQKGGDA